MIQLCLRPRSAVSPLRVQDGASVHALLARLDTLGVLKATAPSARIFERMPPPRRAPRFFLDQVASDHLSERGDVFSWWQFGEQMAKVMGAVEERRPLYTAEANRVAWGVTALRALIAITGTIATRTFSFDRYVVVADDSCALGTTKGRPDCGSCDFRVDQMFIRQSLTPSETVVTAVHEAAHALSALRICMAPGKPPNVYGCGLIIGALFVGLSEGYTAQITTRALAYGRHNAALHRGAQAAHGAVPVPWENYNDTSYKRQQQRLAATLARVYSAYTGRDISARQFVGRCDRPAMALRRYLDQAYFGGDLTFYGLCYHALGRTAFAELAE